MGSVRHRSLTSAKLLIGSASSPWTPVPATLGQGVSRLFAKSPSTHDQIFEDHLAPGTGKHWINISATQENRDLTEQGSLRVRTALREAINSARALPTSFRVEALDSSRILPRSGMVAHACNPSSQETKAGGLL